MAGQWHFAKNGQRGGPVAPEKLQEMISAGQLAAAGTSTPDVRISDMR